ncbi:MAG: DUF2147 domain-containing protein [Pseudomonadota bacterium]
MLAAFLILSASTMPLDVEGVWYTEGGQSQVEIVREGDSVTGRIVWYDGWENEIVLDTENPDEALRGRELLGLPILEGFNEGRNKWRKGKIYDPTEGKTYRSAVYRLDENTLAVEGCVSVICITQEWARVPEEDIVRGSREAE